MSIRGPVDRPMLEDRTLAALFPTADQVREALRPAPGRHPASMLNDGHVRRILVPEPLIPVYSRVGVRVGDEVSAVLIGHEPRVGAPGPGSARCRSRPRCARSRAP